MDEIRLENGSTLSIYEIVCHGFHNLLHNKMASADALMRTRFICARSRVKPTMETKNSASKVIRVTLKSPAKAQSDPSPVLLLPTAVRGSIDLDQSHKLGLRVRWATPGRLIARAFFGGGACERRLGGESAYFRAGRC